MYRQQGELMGAIDIRKCSGLLWGPLFIYSSQCQSNDVPRTAQDTLTTAVDLHILPVFNTEPLKKKNH